MPEPTFHELAQLPPPVLRQLIRRGDYTGHTSGLGQRHLQANLVILQKSWADEFLRFCALNPRACPLLDVSEPGSPHFARLGAVRESEINQKGKARKLWDIEEGKGI